MTPAVVALLAVVVLPLVLLVGDLAVRRGGTPEAPKEPARLPIDTVATPAPAAFSAGSTPGGIKPGQGMVYRGPVVARR